MTWPTDAEREAIDNAFGYVPEPEPLENHRGDTMTDLTAATEATRWPTPELGTPPPDWAKEGLEEVYTALFAAATHHQCADLTGCPHCGDQAERALALFVPFVAAREAAAEQRVAAEAERWKEVADAADDVIRAVLAALNRGPDTDPVIRAKKVVAERDALAALVREAALETYTPDGSERFVAAFHRALGERDALAARLAAAEAQRDALAATVLRVEVLADEWEAAGLWIPGERLREALGGGS